MVVFVFLFECWVIHHQSTKNIPPVSSFAGYGDLEVLESDTFFQSPEYPQMPGPIPGMPPSGVRANDVLRAPAVFNQIGPEFSSNDLYTDTPRRVVDFDPPPERQRLSTESDGRSDGANDESRDDEEYGDMRVAVLVPYVGPGLPVWFDAFADLAAASKDAVDWIIFCEEVCERSSQS